MRRLLLSRAPRALLVLLTLAAIPARAQTRQQLIEDWQRQRDNVLAYLDAMPDSALGFRPTAGVRDFSEQIVHLASTNLEVAALALRGAPGAPFTMDSTQLHQKAALREYTERTFVYVLDAIRATTPSALLRTSALFNQPPQTAARWLALSYEHAAWTLGATVPYLRLNGVTPPAYKQPL